MPDVSVIVPIYNSEETIGACIESILHQSYTDTEVILVDDGSTDESGAICESYRSKYVRIHVIHQSNKGRTEARYVGVQQAHGEWVAFVDSDDTLPCDALQNLYEATSGQTDIVLGNGYTLPNEQRTVIPMSDFRHLAVRGEGTIGVPWGSLYRRTLMTPYLFDLPRHIMMGEDYIFWLRMVFSTAKPVNVVYESVYNKGAEHTSNCFHWTSSYCYELNEFRKAAIPSSEYRLYLSDMITDRLANLFAIALCESRSIWKHSTYYRDIISDIQATNYPLSFKKHLFLALPSLRLRKLLAT